jgi:hypothetical protein
MIGLVATLAQKFNRRAKLEADIKMSYETTVVTIFIYFPDYILFFVV